ncbi:hypothetical protein AB1L42_14830 [Thalassoglobus sp. JC818]|uniref:hypothetical protein n=1 Tax=Thalassoglobus sp. JC818 TaxID=3232136 RepID=UPI00345ABA82
MPKFSESDALKSWVKFFSEYRPQPLRVRQWVMRMHRQKQHDQVIACLKAALINGQSQPWMYEVLALSMEIKNYPKEDVERVVMSLSDFGAVNFENLMYSAAYLNKFDRKQAALKLYRQSSRIAPERHEPYVLGLSLAEEVGTDEDVEWAATGILTHYWSSNFQEKHQLAEDAILNRMRNLRRSGDSETLARLTEALQQAKVQDLQIRLDWSGDADLDLIVEEPPGSICSFETPLTYAGGIHLNDGIGPDRSFEEYICPIGVAGRYRIQVKNTLGRVVGNRAVVTITRHANSPQQSVERKTLNLDGDVASLDIDLDAGRRKQPRKLSLLLDSRTGQMPQRNIPRQVGRPRRLPMTDARMNAVEDFNVARDPSVRRAGAIGFAPVVQTYLDGAALQTGAVISADRRYVRIGVGVQFSTITGVSTFNFPGGTVNQTPFVP